MRAAFNCTEIFGSYLASPNDRVALGIAFPKLQYNVNVASPLSELEGLIPHVGKTLLIGGLKDANYPPGHADEPGTFGRLGTLLLVPKLGGWAHRG